MTEPQQHSPTSPQSSQPLRDLLPLEWLRRFKSSKRASSRVQRHTEAMLAKRYSNLKPELDESEMGDNTRINSPDHHYYPEQSKGIGTLAKLAIGAGLLGTGVGVGVGIPLIIDAMSSTPGVMAPAKTETNTIDWKLGTPIVE